MSFKTNFFTTCNGDYKNFIPIFILSHLYHNDDCHVEIGVDNIDPNLNLSLNKLKEIYNDKFKVKVINLNYITLNGKKYPSIQNTFRFVKTPDIKSQYVYITDIDIICLQNNLSDLHIKDLDNKNLPYSNIVRPKKDNNQTNRRLTGLHFTPYDNYYPIPEYQDLCDKGLLYHDEVFLYELIKKRFPEFDESNTFRPVHGIHVSPNREPTGTMNWGLPKWKKEWVEFRSSDIFKNIEKTFTKYIKDKIKIIDGYYSI